MNKETLHRGIVKENSRGELIINVAGVPACSCCSQRNVCTISQKAGAEIVLKNFHGNFHEGQEVNISVKTSQGLRAVFFGYVFPLICVLSVLIVVKSITGDEGLSGIFSLAVLVPYYMILYGLRSHLRKSFKYIIKPVIK